MRDGEGNADRSEFSSSFAGEPLASSHVVDTEQPWMRLMMYHKAQGLSNKEIAERVHKSLSYISTICRQPWFREQMEAMIEEEGRESYQAVLNGEGLNSLYTLIDARDDIGNKASDRISAADKILDRLRGKAQQTVTHVDGGRTDVAKKQADIEKQLAEVEKELLESGVVAPTRAEGTSITPTLQQVSTTINGN